MILHTYLKEKIRLRQFEVDISYKVDIEDLNMLDKIISDSFDEYRITQLEFEESLYISEDLQNIIMHDVFKDIMLKISPALRHKLSLYYNPDYINDIIYKKLQLKILGYIIEVNGTKNKK